MGMVDVGDKEKTQRMARATVFVNLGEEIVQKIKNNQMPKGPVLETARVAGVLAAKNTPNLIPLCHTIEITSVAIDFFFETQGIKIESTVKAFAKTGVEMEALTACSLAALTVYDMSKMFSQTLEISDLCLVEKRGGKNGDYLRGALQ